MLSEEDVEEYMSEPQQYIKNDLEESDTETRRRLCMKFVQQLSKKYPGEMQQLIGSQVQHLLEAYNQNREQN